VDGCGLSRPFVPSDSLFVKGCYQKIPPEATWGEVLPILGKPVLTKSIKKLI
jgi:hypothetical protein